MQQERPDTALGEGTVHRAGGAGHSATVESTARVNQEVDYCVHLTHPHQQIWSMVIK